MDVYDLPSLAKEMIALGKGSVLGYYTRTHFLKWMMTEYRFDNEWCRYEFTTAIRAYEFNNAVQLNGFRRGAEVGTLLGILVHPNWIWTGMDSTTSFGGTIEVPDHL